MIAWLLERWHEIAHPLRPSLALATGGHSENSLLAFRAAVEKGFGSEVDVHLTADNKLVVVHDSALDRLCGVQKIESTLEDLRGLRLLATDEQIQHLRVLEFMRGSTLLIIEAGQRNNQR